MQDNFDIFPETLNEIVYPKLDIPAVMRTEADFVSVASAVTSQIGNQVVKAQLVMIEREKLAAFVGAVAVVAVYAESETL